MGTQDASGQIPFTPPFSMFSVRSPAASHRGWCLHWSAWPATFQELLLPLPFAEQNQSKAAPGMGGTAGSWSSRVSLCTGWT